MKQQDEIVTLLFSDVEESTRLVERLGAAYAELLAQKRALIRAAISAAGGSEVDCRGDEFFVAFAQPEHAVAAERRIWPPCPAEQTRAARCTSMPT